MKKQAKRNIQFVSVVEQEAAKTHTVLYQINRTECYFQVDLPLSDHPLNGKQLGGSRANDLPLWHINISVNAYFCFGKIKKMVV